MNRNLILMAAILLAVSTCFVVAVEGKSDAAPAFKHGGGDFAAVCDLAYRAQADPIFPEKSMPHQHVFFGNLMQPADLSQTALMMESPSTCYERGDKSLYWTPEKRWNGRLLQVKSRATIYYRHGDKPQKLIRAMPQALELLTGNVKYGCKGSKPTENVPKSCKKGSTLRAVYTFQDCWDKKSIEVGHVSFAHMQAGKRRCDNNEMAVPQITMSLEYMPPNGTKFNHGHLAVNMGEMWMPAKGNDHADAVAIWERDKLEEQVSRCINTAKIGGLRTLFCRSAAKN